MRGWARLDDLKALEEAGLVVEAVHWARHRDYSSCSSCATTTREVERAQMGLGRRESIRDNSNSRAMAIAVPIQSELIHLPAAARLFPPTLSFPQSSPASALPISPLSHPHRVGRRRRARRRCLYRRETEFPVRRRSSGTLRHDNTKSYRNDDRSLFPNECCVSHSPPGAPPILEHDPWSAVVSLVCFRSGVTRREHCRPAPPP